MPSCIEWLLWLCCCCTCESKIPCGLALTEFQLGICSLFLFDFCYYTTLSVLCHVPLRKPIFCFHFEFKAAAATITRTPEPSVLFPSSSSYIKERSNPPSRERKKVLSFILTRSLCSGVIVAPEVINQTLSLLFSLSRCEKKKLPFFLVFICPLAR